MKAWFLPLLVMEGVIAITVASLSGETRTQCGSVAGATRATLLVRDDDGRTTHAHMVRPSVPVTLNGEPVRLEELRIGDRVAVSLVREEGAAVVTTVEARSAAPRISTLSATRPLANVGAFQ